MTIEFKSAGSKMLAVSVPKNLDEEFLLYGGYFPELRSGNWEVIGLSTDCQEHHQAMKEAGIYTVNPYGRHPLNAENVDHYLWLSDKRLKDDVKFWEDAQNRTSEIWILLKIK